ncbi:hypothetical protein ACJX0J_022693, partial [Zea mays]
RSDSEAGEPLVLGAGMLLVHLGRVCRARRPRSPSSSSPSSKCGARVRRAGSICDITFTFTNRCGDTVWPGLLSGSRTPPLETTGFALAPGQLRSLYAPQGWSGRFWGRSGCTFDASGKGSCATGDCGSGEVECRGAGASPPAMLAEFTLDDDGDKDFYDCLPSGVQGEVGSLNDARYLENILLLLTGRQLDTATEIAASRGDVRLAILLSQAGGSMSNRSDLAQTLDQWKMNGLDFDYIEEDWLKVYMLLAGNVQAAFLDLLIDWKRYLGLIMWYQLSPDTPLDIQTMFSAFSSSFDPLDYHFIWHQRSILEAVEAFSSNDLHLLDLSFVYQLLCLGRCHWAIYVILHMLYLDDAPYIHEKLIREVLSQYCESWSRDDAQRQYIVELGIPEEWMHEALALYHEYYGDKQGKAHIIFVTSVAHSMFLALNIFSMNFFICCTYFLETS